jgi:hypothetical protein
VLVKGIGRDGDLNPFAAACDDREYRVFGVCDHMLCWSWDMYFSAAASSENDHGSMNLASRDSFAFADLGAPLTFTARVQEVKAGVNYHSPSGMPAGRF